MGSILISVPDIADNDLVFDDDETRQILKFFWPNLATAIDAMTINSDARRLAQTALIAAIDGSYAMGFPEATFRTIFSPGKNVASFSRKLALRFMRHWWKHATQRDLAHAKIYESVRLIVAGALAQQFKLLLDGIASQERIDPFYAVVGEPGIAWS